MYLLINILQMMLLLKFFQLTIQFLLENAQIIPGVKHQKLILALYLGQ